MYLTYKHRTSSSIQSFDDIDYFHVGCVHDVVIFVDKLELFENKVVAHFDVIKVIDECEASGGGVVPYHESVELIGLVV